MEEAIKDLNNALDGIDILMSNMTLEDAFKHKATIEFIAKQIISAKNDMMKAK